MKQLTHKLACAAWVIAVLTGWTSSAATLYVWRDSPNPVPPYDSWVNAATNIQDAVDAAADGDTALVAGGVYSTGGRAVVATTTNRVVIDKAITVESLMGPEVTVIEGPPVPGAILGGRGIRCVYLGTNAILSGFTLTHGDAGNGGGAWCESSATLTNCVLTSNSAVYGGGAYGGTLNHCTLTGNSAVYGGGAYGGTLYNCILTGNSASEGGGFSGGESGCKEPLGTLYNCTVTGNSAGNGGGVSGGTLYNCIVYFNTGGNYSGEWVFCAESSHFYPAIFNYSCATPLPANGVGNIAENPQMASLTHLSTSSPCIGAGSSTYATGVDIDGEPWADPPCIGADQFTPGQATGSLTLAIEAEYTNVATEFAVSFGARIQGCILTSVWDFGDGTFITNQPIASHAWTAPGTYTVRLTGYNDSFPEGVTTTVQIEVSESVYYVNQGNPTPGFPYTSWATAATNIQDAIEAGATIGRLVLVTNGLYASGSVDVPWTNRIGLTGPMEVRSVNGPGVTLIEGAPGIRCAYLGTNAILDGFTLTNGNNVIGGGAYCEYSSVLTNCVLTGNSAHYDGGGAFQGTLDHCTLSGNSTSGPGGGAYGSTLNNCTLSGNAAGAGGGAYGSTLNNCTVIGNSATNSYGGGGVYEGTLYNCIVYYNTAPQDPNCGGYDLYPILNYCCTTPLPFGGMGNITNAPLFVDQLGGNLRLQSNSPSINAGNNAYVQGSRDLDGRSRIVGGTVDMGVYEFEPGVSGTFIGWLQLHGLPTDGSADAADLDGDLMNTRQEWAADTDPNDGLSFFHIEAISKSSPAMISFPSSSNRIYTLWGTPQLAPPDWTPVPGEQAIPGTGGTLTLSDLTNAPQRFYRVQVNLP